MVALDFFFVMSEVPLLTCMLAGGGSNSVYRCTSRICIFLEETFIYEEETLTTPSFSGWTKYPSSGE